MIAVALWIEASSFRREILPVAVADVSAIWLQDPDDLFTPGQAHSQD
jgi:hypothetical protein